MAAAEIQIPAKTFLCGEYLVLNGGPAIVIATEPAFSARVQGGEGVCQFAAMSPAGRFWKKNSGAFARQSVTWNDPYLGRGGLGGSTAEYFALSWFHRDFSKLSDTEIWSIWREYQGLLTAPGSGADLIGQMLGGISLITPKTETATRLKWNFNDLEFILFHTGQKLATHTHLQKSAPVATGKAWAQAVADVKQGIQESQAALLLQGIVAYRECLQAAGLEAQHTSDLLRKLLNQFPGRQLAAKGCGAMGHDVLAVIFTPDMRDELETWARLNKLQVVANSGQISMGPRVRMVEADA